MMIFNLVFRGVLISLACFIENHIVYRRHIVIKIGRQIQHRLKIPECLRVITAEDPGLTDVDIRISTFMLCCSFFLAALAFCLVMLGGSLSDNWIFCIAVVNPCCVCVLVWLRLILGKRRRLSRTNTYEELESEGDPGFEAFVKDLWSWPC